MQRRAAGAAPKMTPGFSEHKQQQRSMGAARLSAARRTRDDAGGEVGEQGRHQLALAVLAIHRQLYRLRDSGYRQGMHVEGSRLHRGP